LTAVLESTLENAVEKLNGEISFETDEGTQIRITLPGRVSRIPTERPHHWLPNGRIERIHPDVIWSRHAVTKSGCHGPHPQSGVVACNRVTSG